jgi:hypothetical protein
MSTLNDYLKDFPRKPVEAKQSQRKDTPFITNRAFAPESGKCYEVTFEPIVDVNNVSNTVRIRANGTVQSQWVILDANKQFNGTRIVQGYREISCSDSNGCSGD